MTESDAAVDGEVRVIEIHPDCKYIIHARVPDEQLKEIIPLMREWFLGDQHVFMLSDPAGVIEFHKVKDAESNGES